MRYLAVLGVWILGTCVAASENDEARYLVTHQEADSRFINAIERIGDCKIPGAPLAIKKLRVPDRLYPAVSAAQHEEGTIKMLLIFDHDWCVRKASVIQSSGYWRLDDVSLKFAMTLKFQPPVIKQYVDGEPSIIFPIEWGASQRRR